ncbi:TetR/AcrR family transcriptional regulator [Paludibacterium paludis]|uniref:TetR family transcriptional regulator n=1 Tax=Paludibacterium paludis TaxID=1225769 RepID=A0A918UC31_9NEIS|nr:TetR/AcrR family transcriptional regulator [Paludibacterium paludis]GGY28340.1 TetR family transcriptional regulator [Paludibacterium paludis]
MRAALLSAALDIMIEEGFHAVTLNAVARRAEVSKGGLTHHFPSKPALIDALFDGLADEFLRFYRALRQSEGEGSTSGVDAYIKANLLDAGTGKHQMGLAILLFNWPPCRERARSMMAGFLDEDDQGPPERALTFLVCRLAAEGFWFARLLGLYPLPESRTGALLSALLELSAQAARSADGQ